jgi:hypothetical protein
MRCIVLAVCVLAAGCKERTPPEPVKPSAPPVDAGTVTMPADAGVDAQTEAGARVDLGWDLDPQDAARDYVKRYIKTTKRYGDKTDCMLVGKSTDASGGRRAVEVHETSTPPPGARSRAQPCGTANAKRDVFYVDIVGDRLTVDDPPTRAPLAPWPDGSKPDAPPAEVSSINSIREWRTPMADAFQKLKLSPIRIQGYGRGTYLVITLAGWRAPLARDASDAAMKDAANKLCAVNDGRAFAVTAPFDARTWLRIKCDGTYRWEDKR